jgi:hypothetical protein
MTEATSKFTLLIPQNEQLITELFPDRDPFTLIDGVGQRCTVGMGGGMMLAFRLRGDRNGRAMRIMRGFTGQPNITITGPAAISGLLPADAFRALEAMTDASPT